MVEKAIKDKRSHLQVTLSIPSDIGNDLEEIASFNGVSIDNLAYSYIVEGIAGDSRILKGAEFRRHVDEEPNKDDFHSKSSREIVNDFKILY